MTSLGVTKVGTGGQSSSSTRDITRGGSKNMKPGRKPKPRKLKLVEGNPGKRKINRREPQPKSEIPTCPRQLNATARAEWKRVSAILHRNGLISLLDRAALAAYCSSYARYIYFEAKLAKKPSLAIQKLGTKANPYEQASPMFTIMKQSMKDMNSFLAKFGMSPSDRVGLVGSLDPDNRSLAQRIRDRRKDKK